MHVCDQYHRYQRQVKMCISLSLFHDSFPLDFIFTSRYFFDEWEKYSKKQISIRVNVKKIKSSKKKKNVIWTCFRSSRPEMFCKKGVLRNFVKFTGKHLCQSLFFNKVVGLRPAILLKKRLSHRCFPVSVTSLNMACLQIYREWLSLATSLREYLNSKEVS